MAFALTRLHPARGELPLEGDEPAESLVNGPEAGELDEALQPVAGEADRRPDVIKIVPAPGRDDTESEPMQEVPTPEPARDPEPEPEPKPEPKLKLKPEADRKRFADGLRSAVDDLPAARQILARRSLSIETSDDRDPEMLTEVARILACW